MNSYRNNRAHQTIKERKMKKKSKTKKQIRDEKWRRQRWISTTVTRNNNNNNDNNGEAMLIRMVNVCIKWIAAVTHTGKRNWLLRWCHCVWNACVCGRHLICPWNPFFPVRDSFFSIEQRFQRKTDSVDVMLILYKVSCIFYLLRDHYDSKRINQSWGYAETGLVGGFLVVYLWRRRIFFYIVPKKKMISIQVLHGKKMFAFKLLFALFICFACTNHHCNQNSSVSFVIDIMENLYECH